MDGLGHVQLQLSQGGAQVAALTPELLKSVPEGKLAIVNVWASWCGPCRQEHPLLVELGKGLVISVISRTQHQAFLLVLLIGMVDFMFTGYAAPVEGMPQILQWFANFIPAHHWLTILRGILLKGAGLDVLYPHVLILAGLGLVIGTFSLLFVRRALD